MKTANRCPQCGSDGGRLFVYRDKNTPKGTTYTQINSVQCSDRWHDLGMVSKAPAARVITFKPCIARDHAFMQATVTESEWGSVMIFCSKCGEHRILLPRAAPQQVPVQIA